MKIKKIMLLIMISLFMSGCNAHYNLTYIDGSLNETLDITSNMDKLYNGESFSSLINDYYNNSHLLVNYKDEPGDINESELISNYNIYDKSIINSNNIYGLKLGYIYNNDNVNIYKNSTIIHGLYDNIYYSNDYIKTDNIKNVFENYNGLESITISFSTDKKVVNINSDEEKDSIYYWYITKDNYLDKNINIELEDEYNTVKMDKNGYFSSSIIKYIIMFVIIIILLLVVVIYEKVKKSND